MNVDRCSNSVKLLLRYYQVKFEVKKRKSNRFNSCLRSKIFLRLCLEDIFRETLNSEFYSECVIAMNVIDEDITETCEEEDEKRISKTRGNENGVFARSVDEDDSLPPSVSNVYRSISTQIRCIYLQLNSICMNFSPNSILFNSDTPNHKLPEYSGANGIDPIPRKVRPVTQVPATDLKEQKIQKQLRQWFWWRYGSQKDLIDALNSYILEQLLYPQFPISSDSDRLRVKLFFCFRFYTSFLEFRNVQRNVPGINF